MNINEMTWSYAKFNDTWCARAYEKIDIDRREFERRYCEREKSMITVTTKKGDERLHVIDRLVFWQTYKNGHTAVTVSLQQRDDDQSNQSRRRA